MKSVVATAVYFLLLLSTPADLVEKTVTVQTSESGKATIKRTKKIKGDWVREEVELETSTRSTMSGALYNVVTRQIFKMKEGKWTAEGRGLQKEGIEETEKRLKKEEVIPKERPDLVQAKGHMTINGYECDEYACETPTHKITAWVAPSLAKYLAIHSKAHNPSMKVISSQLPDYTKLPGIAVRIISVTTMASPPGRAPLVVTSTSDLVSITEETLPDSDFAVPAEAE